jgi:hypothetical protein
MQLFTRQHVHFVCVILLCACGSAQSDTHGEATYAAPATQGGPAVAPQQQSSDMQLSIAIAGTGGFQAVQNVACNLTSGDLTETTTASGQISSGGAYEGNFDVHQSGTAWTNSLCGAVQDVKLSSVTSVTVKATIPASAANCEGYCTASASVQCQGSSDPNCATNASAACSTTCQASQHVTAQGSLQQSDLATTNNEMASSGQVDAKVDLVFNALE